MLSLKPTLLLISISIVVLFTSQISKSQTPDAKPKPTGSISGHVIIDGKAAAGIPIAAVAGSNINRRDSAARDRMLTAASRSTTSRPAGI